ncbi:hypothetical protein AAHE14_10320, partial [Raoultella ornithinolytica]|uniref:hypothetical protein n=1 Tax=Raoultella ornithinolytica TaxID=54291 RepID=UPI00396716D6
GLTALTAEFTVGEGKLMTHDEPCSMAPDDKHDLISGTCSHLPQYSWIFTSRFELCEVVSTADRNRVGIYVWVIFLCRHSGLQRNFVVFNKESPEGNSARIVQIEQSPKRNTLSTELSNDDHSINTS